MTGPAADGAYADSAAPEGRGAEEVPYEHDQAVADVAARLADLAYAAAARRWDAPDHLRAQATGLSLVPETPLVRELLRPHAMTSGWIAVGRPGVTCVLALIPRTSPGRLASPKCLLMWSPCGAVAVRVAEKVMQVACKAADVQGCPGFRANYRVHRSRKLPMTAFGVRSGR